MSIEIKSRWTGAVIKVVAGDSLRGANLCGADLGGADLGGADLTRADLDGANLVGAKRYIDDDEVITLRGPRPILQIGPIGSRDDYMMGLLTSAGLRVECGCFVGTLERFEAKIRESHADNPRHRDEYLAAARFIKAWAKVETKFADAWEKENPMPVEDGGPK